MSFDENLGANRIDQSHLAPAVEVTPAENVYSVSDKTVAPNGGVKAKQPVSYTHLTLPTNREV